MSMFRRMLMNLIDIIPLFNFTKVNSPNAESFGYFGSSTDISDSYMISGAIGEGTSAAIYVFDIDGTLQHTLAGDNSGNPSSVAITDNKFIIGSYEYPGNGVGIARVYDTNTGSLLHTLNNPNDYGDTIDWFGKDVDICSSYSLVSATQEDSLDGTATGVVYLFSNSTGSLLRTFRNPNVETTSPSDQFGLSISVSQDYSIIGASYEEEPSIHSTNSGVVYVFSNSTGNLIRTINNPNHASTPGEDRFGATLDMTDTHVIISSPLENGTSNDTAGVVYLFEISTGNLIQTFINPSQTTTDSMGLYDVGVNSKYSMATASGVVYVFSNSTGEVIHTASIGGTSSTVSATNTNMIISSRWVSDLFTMDGIARVYDLS